MSSINTNSTGKRYWRSLDELADTPEFRQHVEQEFANYDPDEMLKPTRRSMVKLMAASTALAGVSGLTGCRRWPKETLAPYNERPEDMIPGVPEHYASMMELGGVSRPVIVTSFDGRPIKIEGNPEHPMSNGKTGVYEQASILEMYDPHRSRKVLRDGKKSSWSDFYQAAGALIGNGDGVAVLSEITESPTVIDMGARLRKAAPGMKWYTYEPINRDNSIAGTVKSFGKPLRRHLHLEKADVIACFDADILGQGADKLVNAGGYAAKRRSVDAEGHEISRVYAVEGAWSMTGTNADVRLGVKPSDVGGVLTAVGHALGVPGIEAGEVKPVAKSFVHDLVEDLKAHAGHSVVVVGESQPVAVHDLANRVNAHLKNIGTTITYTNETQAGGVVDQLKALTSALEKGEVNTLIILGGNPVYDAPVDVAFAEALSKAKNTVHLSHFVNETSEKCGWHLPRAHYLECWGDGRAWDGSVTLQQPLIQPLFGGISVIELLAKLTGEKLTGHKIVQRTHEQVLGGSKAWRKSLHQGFIAGSAFNAVDVSVNGNATGLGYGAEGYEVTFQVCNSIYDGRYSNNGWLQELPDPMTKLTWDNALVMSKESADQLDVKHGQLVTLEVGKESMVVAVYLMPGVADNTFALALGYGRTKSGPVGEGNGFNAYQVLHSEGSGFAGANIVKGKGSAGYYDLVTTQDHHYIDAIGQHGRKQRVDDIIRDATRDEYVHLLEHKDDGHGHGHHSPFESNLLHLTDKMIGKNGHPLQLYTDPVDYNKPIKEGHELPYKWGMSIDLSTCIGCNACVIACQAENNIPIVGKAQVKMGREMHWIRIDRYFREREAGRFEAVHQPLTCHHCENAPCEQVCPVAATVHDHEGINTMIYNRCIGTRYCSNNCPYKVRRYNWFDFNAKAPKAPNYTATTLDFPDTQQKKVDPVRKLSFNPEVTVRMRGVMEKCSFCTQRIKAKTIPARNESRRVEDGEIVPACAQTCPTEAILFGDLNDPKSEVTKMHQNKRAYELLKEINVRARNRYLAKITNPVSAHAHGAGEGKKEQH